MPGYSTRVKTASLVQILEDSKTGSYDVLDMPWYTMDRDQHLDSVSLICNPLSILLKEKIRLTSTPGLMISKR
jgi:hypothetical protein